MQSKKSLLALAALSFIATSISTASANDKRLPVKHYWQDNGCWCGVAAAEMVEMYYSPEKKWNGSYQTRLATTPSLVGGVTVGSTVNASPKPCGPNGGVDGNEMPTMVNALVGSKGQRFSWGQWALSSARADRAYKESDTFHKRVVASIDNGDPVILVGHTRYTQAYSDAYRNGDGKAEGQHWYLIIGYRETDGNPNTIQAGDGYFIHDPAHGAGFTHLVTLTPDKGRNEGRFVSHFNVFKHISGNNGKIVAYFQTN